MVLFSESLSLAGIISPLDDIYGDMSWGFNTLSFSSTTGTKEPPLLCDEDLEIPLSNNRTIAEVFADPSWTPLDTDVFLCPSIEQQALYVPTPTNAFNIAAQEQTAFRSVSKSSSVLEPEPKQVEPIVVENGQYEICLPGSTVVAQTARAMPARAAKSRTRASVQREKTPYTKKTTTRKVPDDLKDEDYLERRRRNNLAAKRSRQAHRQREIEQVNKLKGLQKENSELKKKIDKLILRNSKLQTKLLQLG